MFNKTLDSILEAVINLWVIPDDKIRVSKQALWIVPLSCGMLEPNRLPDAEKKILLLAAQVATKYPESRIIFGVTNYLWPSCPGDEARAKMKFLESQGILPKRMINVGGVANTVQETLEIRLAILKLDHRATDIPVVLIADKLHARSARAIWRKLFPKARLYVKSVTGNWNEGHPSYLERSKSLFLAANVFRYLAFGFFGKKITVLRHPARKYAKEIQEGET